MLVLDDGWFENVTMTTVVLGTGMSMREAWRDSWRTGKRVNDLE